MSYPGDEEDTHPNLQRYLKAEGRFDRLMAPIMASPWTLAILGGSHLVAFLLGLWAAR